MPTRCSYQFEIDDPTAFTQPWKGEVDDGARVRAASTNTLATRRITRFRACSGRIGPPNAIETASSLITGASRGIGAATARLAAERGYAVCVNYRANEAAAAVSSRRSRRAGGRAVAVGADVSVEAEVVRLFETRRSRARSAHRALVNNAGILEPQTRASSRSMPRGWRACSRPTSPARSSARAKRCAACRPPMAAQAAPIVNVSSRAAQLGAPGEYVDYAASKAALDALTIGLAKRWPAEGIRVNAVRAGDHLFRYSRQRRRAGPRRSAGPDAADAARRPPDRSRARDSVAAVGRSVVLNRHVH